MELGAEDGTALGNEERPGAPERLEGVSLRLHGGSFAGLGLRHFLPQPYRFSLSRRNTMVLMSRSVPSREGRCVGAPPPEACKDGFRVSLELGEGGKVHGGPGVSFTDV